MNGWHCSLDTPCMCCEILSAQYRTKCDSGLAANAAAVSLQSSGHVTQLKDQASHSIVHMLQQCGRPASQSCSSLVYT